MQYCAQRERSCAAAVQHSRVEPVPKKVFQHAGVYGLCAPVKESSDVTQQLIRRRHVAWARARNDPGLLSKNDPGSA